MKKSAFTLAEVLITLGIIGVVAAMTLPALIQNYQKQVLLSQLKKNYAILNQAVQMMKADNDNVDPVQMSFVHSYWGHSKVAHFAEMGPTFAKYLPVEWHREIPGGTMCFDDPAQFNYKRMDNHDWSPKTSNTGWSYTWKLTNGACVYLRSSTWEWNGTNNEQVFIVDINGSDKNPNVLGKDVFQFVFMPNGALLPNGYHKTQNQMINGGYQSCKENGDWCAASIVTNGWTFPRNYPWK